MALVSVIRRWSLRDNMSIREISKRTGLSRNTVRKYLRSNDLEPRYRVAKRPSLLDEYAVKLAGWLKAESHKPRKQRRTVLQLHKELVALGYQGSYSRVSVFARHWREARHRETDRRTFVPLHFEAGEAFQFDWSEDWTIIGGARCKLQVAHIKLSHSRAFLMRAYPLQSHEMLFDAHWHAFRVFGGVPRRGIYDNMKTAVDKVLKGKERQVNLRFMAMANHYVFGPEFCNPAAGWEKGQIEKNVRDGRSQLWLGMPEFADLAALNDWLEANCRRLWQETPHGHLPGSIADVWEEEKASLMALPPPFDGFVEISKRVSPTCLVAHEHIRYSVPALFANRAVSLRVYPERIVIVADGVVLCAHDRIIDRTNRGPIHTVYDWRHYLMVIQQKPGALRNGAPFEEMPPSFRQLQKHLLQKRGGDREMVDILSLVLQHDEQAVITAVELALEAGVPTKTHILNLLHRLTDGTQVTSIELDLPGALTLNEEPRADTARYDHLRQTSREVRHAP